MTEQQASSEEVIDWAVALESAGGDESLLQELTNIALAESQERLSDIHVALLDQNVELIHRAAHTLKTLLKTFGAPSTVVAEQLEHHFKEIANDDKEIRQGKKDPGVITPERLVAAFADAPRMVNELEPQLRLVIAAIQARLAQ
jgi:HPt (histidine-containing phosphotransfer) domain-containing protein